DIAFFVADHRAPDHEYSAASHSHSEDEIIHMLDGTLHVGPVLVPAGASIAVPAHRRYGFRSPGGYRFLNYRAAVSTMTSGAGRDTILETVDAVRAAR